MNCPKCNSENVRYRQSRNNYICDDCDEVFIAEEKAELLRIFINLSSG
jgi:transposase-like protein